MAAILSTDPLRDFLRAAAERPFSWGEHDCLMWLAEWVGQQRGFDPAANWRGRYRTAMGATRILRRRGGAVAHLDLCLAPFGVRRTREPRRGDIAVVRAPEGDTGGIVLGHGVATFGAGSLFVRPLPVVAAWRV